MKEKEESGERRIRNEIAREVVAGIEKKAKAQVDDKPIAKRTVGQSAKQSWDCSPCESEEEEEGDWQKEDQMEMQWVEDEKMEEILERGRAEGVPMQAEVLQKVPELVIQERMCQSKKNGSHRRKEKVKGWSTEEIRTAETFFWQNVPEGFWAGRSLALEPFVKRAKRHVDGVPYPELLWKFAKRDWQGDLATTRETCQRHADGLSQWIVRPHMSSWLFLKTRTFLRGCLARRVVFELWEEKQFSVVSLLTTKTAETLPSTRTTNSCATADWLVSLAQELVTRAERHGMWPCCCDTRTAAERASTSPLICTAASTESCQPSLRSSLLHVVEIR